MCLSPFPTGQPHSHFQLLQDTMGRRQAQAGHRVARVKDKLQGTLNPWVPAGSRHCRAGTGLMAVRGPEPTASLV